MRLSTKGEYGLLAIIDLALYSHQAPIQSAQIAERQNIPKQYLDQLLLVLKKAGLVESSRGRQGGYQLARPAGHINLLQVVRALEGSIDCMDVFMREGTANEPTREILKDLWSEIFSHASEVLRKTTVDEVCEKRKKLTPQIMYYI